MPEQTSVNTPAPDVATTETAAAPSLIETDYLAYQRWRNTGEQPEAQVETDTTETPAAGDETPAETATDATDTVEDPETEEEESETSEAPKKKGGYQRKIDKITREKDELAARLAAVEAKLAGDEPAGDEPAAAAASTSDKPLPEQFDTYEEYVDKLTDWKLDQRSAKAQQAQAETAGRERATEIGKQWQDRQVEARKVYADFDKVTQSDIPVSDAMSAVLLESEQGADLAYWLGKHPEDAERISKLHPLAAARELGRIEKDIAKPASKPQPPAATRAPKPITPVTRGGSAGSHAGGVYDEKTSNDFGAWLAARNAQLGKK